MMSESAQFTFQFHSKTMRRRTLSGSVGIGLDLVHDHCEGLRLPVWILPFSPKICIPYSFTLFPYPGTAGIRILPFSSKFVYLYPSPFSRYPYSVMGYVHDVPRSMCLGRPVYWVLDCAVPLRARSHVRGCRFTGRKSCGFLLTNH